MARHRLQTGYTVHGPYQKSFADSTARLADAGPYLSSESIAGGSANPIKAVQTDTLAEYILANHSPITWSALVPGSVGSHAIGGSSHVASTLAELNTKVSDATLDDDNAPRPADQLLETGGPTLLDVGLITNGQYLKRVGTTVVGATGGDVNGPASSVVKGIPVFSDTTGKVLIDSQVRNYGALAADPSSPSPSNGDLYFNTALEIWMSYNTSRTKWLSLYRETFSFSGSAFFGTAPGSYYASGLTFADTRGIKARFNGTIVALGYTRDDTDSATFEITEGGTARATLASSATSGYSNALNGNFSQGGILGARNQSGGNTVTGAIGFFTVRWRV